MKEANLPIFHYHGCAIHNQDWSRFVEFDTECLVSKHCRLNSICSPISLTSQHPSCEGNRVFETNAAVAEITTGSCEQLSGRCAVHIYVVHIGKIKFDQSEGVLRTR